jgi:hypothetical protein
VACSAASATIALAGVSIDRRSFQYEFEEQMLSACCAGSGFVDDGGRVQIQYTNGYGSERAESAAGGERWTGYSGHTRRHRRLLRIKAWTGRRSNVIQPLEIAGPRGPGGD